MDLTKEQLDAVTAWLADQPLLEVPSVDDDGAPAGAVPFTEYHRAVSIVNVAVAANFQRQMSEFLQVWKSSRTSNPDATMMLRAAGEARILRELPGALAEDVYRVVTEPVDTILAV